MEPGRGTSNPTIHIALEPVTNALNSFSLLTHPTISSGFNSWVEHTANSLTTTQRQTNRLLFEGLRDALTPDRAEPNFPSYLHNLSELNPYLLRQRVIESIRRRFSARVTHATTHTKYLINDLATYLDCIQTIQGQELINTELHTQIHALLQDPPALRRLIVEHLETLWKTTFVAEWRRVQSALQWQVEMFTNSLQTDASIENTFMDLTGRHLPQHILPLISDTTEIILIPSWHTGRHITIWDGAAWDENDWGGKEVLRLFVSEPPNYDVAGLRGTRMSNKELQVRMSALADTTRLDIINLLTQQDELSAQQILSRLELSQSSISRHLKQLTSLGYLYERRMGEGANKTYRLSSYHFRRTAQAIENLLATPTSSQKDYQLPKTQPTAQSLKRFLNERGQLHTWPPAKQKDKLLILEYLAKLFKPGQTYHEKEVNALLLEFSTFNDTAALRRALCEYRFLDRTDNGSKYWLIETTTNN